MKTTHMLSMAALLFALVACGSSTSTSTDTDSTSTTTETTGTTLVMEQASNELLALSKALSTCSDEDAGRDEFTNIKCLLPDNYTVGTKKIEFVSCGDSDCTDESSIDDVDNATTLYESDVSTGFAANLTGGVEFGEDDLEVLTPGNYSGIRFTIAYLQQTIAADDIDTEGFDSDMIYRVCTMDAGCPDASESEPGDIMVDHDGDGTYSYVDDDVGEEAEFNDIFVAERPANPAQLEGFSTLGDEGSPEADPVTGAFQVIVANATEDGEVQIDADTDYTITTTFTVGGAFKFDDSDDDDKVDFDGDGHAEPGKPASIAFTVAAVTDSDV